MAAIDHVSQVLSKHFPGSKSELEYARPSPKFGGVLLWNDFEGYSQAERQQRLWQVLRQDLPADEQGLVTAIFTLTPHERAEILAGE